MLKSVLVLGGLYVGLCIFMFLMQGRLLYLPAAQWVATPADVGMAFESVALSTDDGLTLDAWWIPAEAQRGVLLFCHGNAGNISHRLESIRQFRQLGLSVFIFDYRGYGRSQGQPSEAGTYQDVQAAWDYLIETRGIAPEQVVIFGRSLGGGVAAHLAAQVRAGGVILESTFTSVPDMAVRLYPWLPVRRLSRFIYPVAENMPAIQAPLLILHSLEDELIPYSMGQQLFELATEPRYLVPLRGTHNDGFLRSEPDYSAAIDGFLQRYLGSATQ